MLIQPTIEKLCAMRLRGMAEAFEQQQQDANIHGLSFEERLRTPDLVEFRSTQVCRPTGDPCRER